MHFDEMEVSWLMTVCDEYDIYVHYVLRMRIYVYITWNGCYVKINEKKTIPQPRLVVDKDLMIVMWHLEPYLVANKDLVTQGFAEVKMTP